MKRVVTFWSSLRVRVMMGVVIPLTIVLAISAWVQISQHRELMLENLKAFSLSVGDGVETALSHAMLSQDNLLLNHLAQQITERGTIRRVMILDTQGRVQLASQPSDVGRSFPVDRGTSYSAIVTEDDGSQAFRNVTPIQNRSTCQPCHGTAAATNGTLIIDLPYEAVQADLLADLKQSVLISAAALVLVSVAIYFLLSQIVIARLERLAGSLARFARGDFSVRAPVSGKDEVAAFAETMNTMADGLADKAQLEQALEENACELERRSARLDALYRVALESSRSLNLDQVMHAALESALTATSMEAGEIRLVTGGNGHLQMQASISAPDGFVADEDRIAVGECLCGRVVARAELYVASEINRDAHATRLACRKYGFCTLAAVPLRARGGAIGVLSLHSRGSRTFSGDDVAMLKALGDQLGIAIDNARLYTDMEERVRELSRRLQHLAVTEERVRLAREMHDGFAQALSVLNLKIQYLRSNPDDQAAFSSALDEMGELVSETYDDVRQSIGDLRMPVAQDGRIVDTLVNYAQNFALRYDLTLQTNTPQECLQARCTPDALPQVLRIVQEVLSNVRKHAHARHVDLGFAREGNCLTIRLHDDGRGFDPEQAKQMDGHFGLTIIQERATSFGGFCEIESRPGDGSTVLLQVPLAA